MSYDKVISGVNQRSTVKMTKDEIFAFLKECRERMSLATFNSDGTIHLVEVGYAFLDGFAVFETKEKAQKVVNLKRDPRLTCMIADGAQYSEFRGLQIVGSAEIIDDLRLCCRVGIDMMWRHSRQEATDEDRSKIERMMRNRVAVRIHPKKFISWDHRKL